MKSERQNRHAVSVRANKARASRNQTESDQSPASIDVERSGGWMPPEDLRAAALDALSVGGDVALNLQGIDHLDSSALQILLALDMEQKKRGQNLHLASVSLPLRQWFDFAGVADHFSITERKNNE